MSSFSLLSAGKIKTTTSFHYFKTSTIKVKKCNMVEEDYSIIYDKSQENGETLVTLETKCLVMAVAVHVQN